MNNRQVAHLWNAQTRDGARGSNFYFAGPTIYSYGSHFPIATIHKRKADSLVLFADSTYSVTTSKHQSYARGACTNRHSVTVPHCVPRCHGDHAANLDALAERQTQALARARKAMSSSRASMERESAERARADYSRYCAFFGLRRKPLPMLETEFNAAVSRAYRIENPDPASADKRERAKAQRIARKREKEEREQAMRRARDFYRIGAARTSFRLGDAWGRDFEALRSSACALRVNGDDIETSWGARIPLAAAPAVWRYAEHIRRGGGTDQFEDTGRRMRIGDYTLDRIDADGTLHVGCHTIPHSELRSMAHMLGLS